MKTLNSLFFTLLISASVCGAPKITAVINNGQWDVNSTWDLNRQPQDNDTIVIPAGITVVLDHSASLNNVYIRIYGTLRFIGGMLTIDILSTIYIQAGGKIVGTSNSEQIKLGGIHKYKGGEGTITGPAIANAASGNGFVFLTLPVKFISFYAAKTGSVVELTWSTAEEINNSHFNVQRSTDGSTWKDIAVVMAVSKPAPINKYAYSDKSNNSGTVYYRLKQVDKDGRYTYSTIKTIHHNRESGMANVYVSAKQTIAIEFNEQVTGKVIVRVVGVNGQSLREQHFTQPAYHYQLQVANAVPGVYVMQVISDTNKAIVKKVVL